MQIPTDLTIIKNNEKISIAIEEVKVGDIIKIKAGDKILGGIINIDELIHYKVTKYFSNSTLSTITSMLENSLLKKPK